MILGLGCKKQVGKDTVADYLVRTYNFTKLSFAEPLKELCSYAERRYSNSISYADYLILIERWKHAYANHSKYRNAFDILKTFSAHGTHAGIHMSDKENGKSRRFLQYIGTDIFRTINDNFWIECMDIRLSKIPKEISVVIPDVRFKNEKKYIDAVGYSVLIQRPSTTEIDTHKSENDLDVELWEYTIDNTSTISNLYHQAEDLVLFLEEQRLRRLM